MRVLVRYPTRPTLMYVTHQGWVLARAFLLAVAGESHRNSDGTSRQEILARCTPGEFLGLRREPDNPHDPDAVKVLRLNGEQIGYLPRGTQKSTI